MKKIALINLTGPVWVIVLRAIEAFKRFSVLGFDGVYDCEISVYKPCSLFDYLFKGADAFLTYISILISYACIFLVVGLIFLLIKMYKNKKDHDK
jgi:hypothetical protein